MEEIHRSIDDFSYAGVDGGQLLPRVEKKDYPFLLYVDTGKEDQEAITRDTWKTLAQKIADRCLSTDLEGKGLESDFSAFSKGAGIIATVDDNPGRG